MVTGKRLRWVAIFAIAVGFIYFVTRPNIIRVGIAPFPDHAIFANVHGLGLEKRYGTRVELVPMPAVDILPTIVGGGDRIQIGLVTYIDFLTKYQKSADPAVFVFPAFAFKDGTFVAYKEDVPKLEKGTIRAWQSTPVWQWLNYRMGAARDSIFEMMLFYLANTHGDEFRLLTIVDTPISEGLSAVEQGKVDIAATGLTPLAEAEQRGARPVLTMEDLGFADITGFVVKKSVYDRRRRDIENVIAMWFVSAAHVMADLNKNSQVSLAFLNRHVSTSFTLDQFKKSLGQEYFPLTRTEARIELVETSGRFSALTIGRIANDYLLHKGILKERTPLPEFQ